MSNLNTCEAPSYQQDAYSIEQLAAELALASADVEHQRRVYALAAAAASGIERWEVAA